jgi:ribosomal subunit interface protein
MKVPLEISSRNVDLTEELKNLIQEKAGKLRTFHDGIISCRVMVEVPHRSQKKGHHYNVRIELTIPGGEVVVKREPGEDLRAVIVSAFDIAERQLKSHSGRQRGEVKTHEEKPTARVDKLFPDEGYGFLVTLDGREIYFHENAVLGVKFKDLAHGTIVSFVEREGEKGAQASSVTLF